MQIWWRAKKDEDGDEDEEEGPFIWIREVMSRIISCGVIVSEGSEDTNNMLMISGRLLGEYQLGPFASSASRDIKWKRFWLTLYRQKNQSRASFSQARLIHHNQLMCSAALCSLTTAFTSFSQFHIAAVWRHNMSNPLTLKQTHYSLTDRYTAANRRRSSDAQICN